MTLDPDETDFTVLTPYLTDELVIITRADTGAKSLRGLKGASLAMIRRAEVHGRLLQATGSSWTASARSSASPAGTQSLCWTP